MGSRVTSVWIPELKKRISFRVRDEDWPIWEEFKRIAKRDPRPTGTVFLQAITEYVLRHYRIHNPQMPLTVFIGEPKITCKSCGKATATFIDISAQGEFPVCKSCHERHEKVGLLKGWRKI